MKSISSYKLFNVNGTNIQAGNDTLVISYGKKNHAFTWKDLSPKLFKATAKERKNFQLSPSGYGLHWPDLDEDISINALLKSRLK